MVIPKAGSFRDPTFLIFAGASLYVQGATVDMATNAQVYHQGVGSRARTQNLKLAVLQKYDSNKIVLQRDRNKL
jgi:hypothetical protein